MASSVTDKHFTQRTNDPLIPYAAGAFSIIDCIFDHNQNYFAGGAIYLAASGTDLEINKSIFSANSARIGGAIAFMSNTMVINNGSFINNQAQDGVHIYATSTALTFAETKFILFNIDTTGLKNLLNLRSDTGSITFEKCNFQKPASVPSGSTKPESNTDLTIVLSNQNPKFTSCTFADVSPGGATVTTPIYITAKVALTITFSENGCVNGKVINNVQQSAAAQSVVAIPTAADGQCTFVINTPIPDPTPTIRVEWGEASYISLGSIIFFILISIFGIIFVSCSCCSPKVPEMDTDSELLEDDLDKNLNIDVPPEEPQPSNP